MTVSGHVESGFEVVAEEFERNFTERDDVGAAFAVTLDGRPVVDLWGGVASKTSGRPWQEDTLQLVFSGSKGFVAVCLLMLIERGSLRLDETVAHYWPEFGVAGKEGTLVSQLVSHQAALPGVRAPLKVTDLTDHTLMARLLAEQEPFWLPGERICYHADTFGWLCGELVRRIDGRTVGQFFHDEVAEALGLELWIGLPEEQEPRVSTLTQLPIDEAETVLCGDEIYRMIFDNPPGFEEDIDAWNTRAFHAAELPAANAIGTARSIARLYGCLARGGEVDGVRILEPDTVRLGRTPLAQGFDACSGASASFGVGFQVPCEATYLGPADAFGHGGAGGSVHAAWPTDVVGVSYAMNELRWENSRVDAMLAALRRALDQRGT